ncbi:MAG: hypothetical protein U5M23_14580 [Marinagarivorans sp.]|nr:hypothetical protein [Marinagarivorans sp.]
MTRLYFFLIPCLFLFSACQPTAAPYTSEYLLLKSINSAAISEAYLIIGSLDQGALVYSKSLKAPIYHWHMGANDPAIDAIAIASNAPTAITTSANNLVIWDLATGKSRHFLTAPAGINSVAINDEGSLAALGLANQQAIVIDLNKGGIIHTLNHRSAINTVALWQKTRLLTGEEANQATLWSLTSGKQIATQSHGDGVTKVGFLNKGELALSSSRYDAIKIWQTQENGQLKNTLSTRKKAMQAGKRLVDFATLNNAELLLGYSDRAIEWRKRGEEKIETRWNLTKKIPLTIDSKALIAVGIFNHQKVAVTSNGQLHTLEPIQKTLK